MLQPLQGLHLTCSPGQLQAEPHQRAQVPALRQATLRREPSSSTRPRLTATVPRSLKQQASLSLLSRLLSRLLVDPLPPVSRSLAMLQPLQGLHLTCSPGLLPAVLRRVVLVPVSPRLLGSRAVTLLLLT